MKQLLPRTLIVGAISMCFGAFAVAACTHTTDRAVVPVGGGDASMTEPDTDASVAPIGPVARSHHESDPEPPPDFSLVRSPELGGAIARSVDFDDVHYEAERSTQALPNTGGGAGVGGSGGEGGSDHRPVSAGGSSYF